MRRGRAALRAMVGKRALDEPRLDQLFAEPVSSSHVCAHAKPLRIATVTISRRSEVEA